MFNSISWLEFLTAVGLSVGLYYTISTVLLYRSDILSLFKQRRSDFIDSTMEENKNESNESIDLMGKVRFHSSENVPHENIVESEELNVSPAKEIEEPIKQAASRQDELLNGAVADLLEEIKTVVAEFTSSDREEVTLVFKSLLGLYPQLVNTAYKDSISLLILNSLKESSDFKPELKEINSWWPELKHA